jgi:hypothetical protein
MKAKDAGALLLLSAMLGGSFLFIRVATRSRLDLRAHWRHSLVIGILDSVIPFIPIATAKLHLTVGLAALLNAITPSLGGARSLLGNPRLLRGCLSCRRHLLRRSGVSPLAVATGS